MRQIWSDEFKLETWLRVELAATDAWAELGVVPADEAAALRAAATPPSPERVAEIEARTHHDLAAFVDAVAEQVGPSARFLHYGLTSSDVLDTALALQVAEAGGLILSGLDGLIDALSRRAHEHRSTAMVGRTHGIQAEPLTFGVKLASFAFEMSRARTRIETALAGATVGKLAGAVGIYGGGDPRVEERALATLGLEREPASTQVVARDRLAELMCSLAIAAASLERLATEVRHLARTELREVQEPFGKGQKGSSAMPHKRNPIVAERICGLSRVVRAGAIVAMENVPLWHERDISHSSAERVTVPDSFTALDYMLDRATWLVEGLVVDGEQMGSNLALTRGLLFSQRVLLALVAAGCTRDEAYRLVQTHALAVWDEAGATTDFRTLLEGDEEVTARLSADDLDRAFDLETSLKHADTVLERLEQLTDDKEIEAHA